MNDHNKKVFCDNESSDKAFSREDIILNEPCLHGEKSVEIV